MKTSSLFLRKALSTALVAVMLFMLAMVFVPLPARAAGADVTCRNESAVGATSINCALTNTPAGDSMMTAFQYVTATACGTGTLTPTSSPVFVWTVDIQGQNAENGAQCLYSVIAHAANSGGTQTVTVTWTEAGMVAAGGLMSLEAATFPITITSVVTSTDTTINAFFGSTTSYTDQVNSITQGIVTVVSSEALMQGTTPTVAYTAGFTGIAGTTVANNCDAAHSECQNMEYNVFGSGTSTQAPIALTQPGGAGPIAPIEVAAIYNAGTGSGTQTQNIGSCPSKNTATFALANSTIYMYYGTAPGNVAVQNIETFVASVTGSQSRTLRLLIYETQAPASAGLTLNTGSVSVGFPLFKIIDQSYVLTAGTKNSLVLTNVAVGVTAGNLWGVGIVGDSHILINQSSTSGIFTESGAVSTSAQPNKFTTAGTGVSTQLFLCAGAIFASQLISTTTVTQSASTTISTTITNTVNTIGTQLFSTSSNWPVIFFILLIPAGLFLGVTKNLSGALLGLMIGAIIGIMMGILPAWAFIGLTIAMVSIAFVANRRD